MIRTIHRNVIEVKLDSFRSQTSSSHHVIKQKENKLENQEEMHWKEVYKGNNRFNASAIQAKYTYREVTNYITQLLMNTLHLLFQTIGTDDIMIRQNVWTYIVTLSITIEWI
eukprot:723702_1